METRGSFEWRVPRKSVVTVNGCFHGNTGLLQVTGAAETCCDCEWLFPRKHGIASSSVFHGGEL